MNVQLPPKFSVGERVLYTDFSIMGIVESIWYDKVARCNAYYINTNDRTYPVLEDWLKPAPYVEEGDVVKLDSGKIVTVETTDSGGALFTIQGDDCSVYHISMISERVDVSINNDELLQILEM